MKLGILGGTFDPVHSGHLAMARAAKGSAGLDRVEMVPCATPPHKHRAGLTSAFHRFAMASLLVPSAPWLGVSPVELTRGGVSYTIDTLLETGRRDPASDIYLIVGSDSYAELPSWRSYDRILSLAAIIVVPRDDENEAAYRRRLPEPLAGILLPAGASWPGSLNGRLPLAGIAASKPVPVSSTEIRARVARGESIEGLVPEPVAAYIERQGLYAQEKSSS